jgi:hypothetical protein
MPRIRGWGALRTHAETIGHRLRCDPRGFVVRCDNGAARADRTRMVLCAYVLIALFVEGGGSVSGRSRREPGAAVALGTAT